MHVLPNINFRELSNCVMSKLPAKCVDKRVALLFATLVAVGGGIGFWRWNASKNQLSIESEADFWAFNESSSNKEIRRISVSLLGDYPLCNVTLVLPGAYDSNMKNIIRQEFIECELEEDDSNVLFTYIEKGVGVFCIHNEDDVKVIKTSRGFFRNKISIWNEDNTFTPITKEKFIEFYEVAVSKNGAN
ncbi:MAG: hypothetical protein ChlgKO_14610 [Chlamydiales bacterium]